MKNIFKILITILPFAAVLFSQQSLACGGLFCANVPINQAGEQIVFRQDGSDTTAMIKINYVGSAEDFGWVLPVPETPEVSLGNDMTFTELEANTRPQFNLSFEGSLCPGSSSSSSSGGSTSSGGSGFSIVNKSEVLIESAFDIGAFNAQIVSSDDAEALAVWLAENNLDLTESGSELLAPYIAAKSKFVVLKLKNGADVGSIQPIILKYQSPSPVIPMTLTAVATQDNLGVLVWLLGEGRGVPENFHHVTPNYTRLNWSNGTRAAYLSYQNLITEAMDDAGGQGFATDFAGYMPELSEQLTNAKRWKELLPTLAASTDANFISLAWDELNPLVQSAIRVELPTSNTFVYQDPVNVLNVFTVEQLKLARAVVLNVINDQVIASLDNAVDILDDNLYLTRLYTTLSADEMTKNPKFSYNTAMGDQQLDRNATLSYECIDQQNKMTLTLGEGTGREDEVVLESWDGFIPTLTSEEQGSVWRVEKTAANADPVLLAKNDFELFSIGAKKVAVDLPKEADEKELEAKEDPALETKSSGGAIDLMLMCLFGLMLIVVGTRKSFWQKR